MLKYVKAPSKTEVCRVTQSNSQVHSCQPIGILYHNTMMRCDHTQLLEGRLKPEPGQISRELDTEPNVGHFNDAKLAERQSPFSIVELRRRPTEILPRVIQGIRWRMWI